MPHHRDDVIAAVRAAFSADRAEAVLSALDRYGVEPHERERGRVQLAIVALSEGSEDRLLGFVQTAKTDYRDILHWHATGPLTPEQGQLEQRAALRVLERWGNK